MTLILIINTIALLFITAHLIALRLRESKNLRYGVILIGPRLIFRFNTLHGLNFFELQLAVVFAITICNISIIIL